MKVFVQIQLTGKKIELEVDESTQVDVFKALVEVETGYLNAVQVLIHRGRHLEEIASQTFKELGIKNNDTILLASIEELNNNPQQALMLEAQAFIQQYIGNKYLLDQIKANNKELHDAIVNQNVNYVINYIMALKQQAEIKKFQEMQEYQQIEANFMEPESQKKIEQMIKQENINKNLDYAQENMPENFIKVPMLYIDCSVNNIPIHAFVDSGAQSTILSKKCAEKAELTKLLDERFKGIAIGVGKGKIIGKVHAAPLEIGGHFFPCSFTVMDSDTLNVDLILGLDNLRKHRCCIDLATNTLGIMNGEVRVPFLQEGKAMESFHSGGIPEDFIDEEGSPQQKEEKKAVPSVKQPIPAAKKEIKKEMRAAVDPNIQRLMSEGLSQQDAAAILLQFNGNIDMALAFVMQQKTGF